MIKNDFETWLEYYQKIKNHFCGKCKIKFCPKHKKLSCIEQYLFIAELWEIEQIYHGEVKS